MFVPAIQSRNKQISLITLFENISLIIAFVCEHSGVYITVKVTQPIERLHTVHHPCFLLLHISSVYGGRARGWWRQRATAAGASVVQGRLFDAGDKVLPRRILRYQTPRSFRLVYHSRCFDLYEEPWMGVRAGSGRGAGLGWLQPSESAKRFFRAIVKLKWAASSSQKWKK